MVGTHYSQRHYMDTWTAPACCVKAVHVPTPVKETAGLRYMQCSGVDIQALRNRWIQAEPPSTHVQNDGPTLLFTASQSGHLDIVQLLIKSGVALDCCDNGGWTPLMCSSQQGCLYVTRKLLNQDVAVVNAQKADLWTPLHLTSASGHLNISQLLIQRRAEVDKRDEL
jgi:ankyrin repeat protein